MNVTPLAIPEVLLLQPQCFEDPRGYFFESYNKRDFERAVGRSVQFVQDNHSLSIKGVLRGLHFQSQQIQGKLVRVVIGEIFDVAVDVRHDSPTFGRWVGTTLSAANRHQLWIPEGFAHGFLVLSEIAEVLYKATDFYAPQHEHCLLWNDPTVSVEWPLSAAPLLSDKDQKGCTLMELEPCMSLNEKAC